jgi:peptide chain release factor 2
MQTLSSLDSRVQEWRELESTASDLLDLAQLIEGEGEDQMASEIAQQTEQLEAKLATMRFRAMLGGPHDHRSAILAIYAGAGGTESQDWAEMLLRMYLRWAEQRGFASEIYDQTPGEEAGLKSVTVEISGQYAYGYLRSEKGVHRLVRISPFDNAHRRHTSFALVDVIPDIGDEISVDINPDDIRTDVYRASGHGGQNVQKNSTAIRLTHLPTGIVVQCQNERSQAQNRERAMAVLRARLYDLELQRQEEEMAKLRGEHVSAGWGNQIRSYVLHPYRMVKDLRTDYETGNTDAVLDGGLDEMIEAYLKHAVGNDA